MQRQSKRLAEWPAWYTLQWLPHSVSLQCNTRLMRKVLDGKHRPSAGLVTHGSQAPVPDDVQLKHATDCVISAESRPRSGLTFKVFICFQALLVRLLQFVHRSRVTICMRNPFAYDVSFAHRAAGSASAEPVQSINCDWRKNSVHARASRRDRMQSMSN